MTRSNPRPETDPKPSDLLLRQKVEAMIEYGYVALRQFPKFERHVLGAEIRQTMWALLRLVITAHKRYHKKSTLQDMDVELDLLRSQVRAAKGLAYLDWQKYETWARLNDGFGRLVGGWIRSMTASPMQEALWYACRSAVATGATAPSLGCRR